MNTQPWRPTNLGGGNKAGLLIMRLRSPSMKTHKGYHCGCRDDTYCFVHLAEPEKLRCISYGNSVFSRAQASLPSDRMALLSAASARTPFSCEPIRLGEGRAWSTPPRGI